MFTVPGTPRVDRRDDIVAPLLAPAAATAGVLDTQRSPFDVEGGGGDAEQVFTQLFQGTEHEHLAYFLMVRSSGGWHHQAQHVLALQLRVPQTRAYDRWPDTEIA